MSPRHRVVVCDNTFVSESSEEAERLRDPSHVRNYSAPEWHSFFELAGLEVADEQRFGSARSTSSRGSTRTGCAGDDAARVRELLGDRDRRRLDVACRRVVIKGRRALMAIIVDNETRLVVQGLTGSEGRFHGLRNREYGTKVVAGVTPGQGRPGRRGHPVFDTVADAVEKAGANTSLIFVPARFAADAIYEAVDAGIADRRSASPSTCRRTTCCASTPTSARRA